MNSTQLNLRLDWGCEPWEGRSPRSLTQAPKALFLSQEAQKDDCFFVDPCQVDMFTGGGKGPRRESVGAPSLLPLPRRGNEIR